MKVLFIGGTGNISGACVELAVRRGMDVTLLNRGRRDPEFDLDVPTIVGDRNDPAVLAAVAAQGPWDVVANFVGYTPDQVERDVAAFAGHTRQYVFISTASAYQKPVGHYLITESTPLCNPFWQYSRNKIACEDVLVQAYRATGFPMTIVRPSLTYGQTWIPCAIGGVGYTIVDRMRRGLPVISHGDGTSLWVVTHNTDFAVGFVGLFGAQKAIGEAFHITTDEVLTWDQIYTAIGHAAGVEPKLVHMTSDVIAALYPDVGANLIGDKAASVVFDNSKIKRVVPDFHAVVRFAEGIARSVAWFDADPARRVVSDEANRMIDHLLRVRYAAAQATERA